MGEIDLELIDNELELIPITWDYAFKSVFKENLELLKRFLIVVLKLHLNSRRCRIELLDGELPKEIHKEYQKNG